MASSMCGGDQVRSTKITVSCLQSNMSAAGIGDLYFIEGNMNSNMYCEILHDPLPSETGSQGSVPAWQWLQTHLQDDHCFTEEAEGKAGQACLLTWTQWNIFGGSSSRRGRCAKSQISASCVTSSWRSIPVATSEALVNSMPRRVKAILDNDGGHTKYWQLTWCMLILTTFPKGCTHFCWQGFSF